MPTDYLDSHKQFPELIRIVAEQRGIDPALVEKDYWIETYAKTSALYYGRKPTFDQILERIGEWIDSA